MPLIFSFISSSTLQSCFTLIPWFSTHTNPSTSVCGKQVTNNAPTATQPANPPNKQQKHAQDAMLPASTCTAPWLLPFVQRSPILEVYRDEKRTTRSWLPVTFPFFPLPPSVPLCDCMCVCRWLTYFLLRSLCTRVRPVSYVHASPVVIVAVAQSYIGRVLWPTKLDRNMAARLRPNRSPCMCL